MIRISPEQFHVLARHAEISFEERVLRLLRDLRPRRMLLMDAVAQGEFIRYAMNSAAKYDMASEQEVCMFAGLMLMLGRDFDIDPRFAWAADLLADRALAPDARLDVVFEVAVGDRPLRGAQDEQSARKSS